MCTPEKIQCISRVKIDEAECLNKCSGMTVSSFYKLPMEDAFQTKLIKYLHGRDSTFPKDLIGCEWSLQICKTSINLHIIFLGSGLSLELRNMILSLSNAYWNYKGFYDFQLGYNFQGSG